MIEVKLLKDARREWMQVTTSMELHNIDFSRAKMRINDVVYTEKTEECITAFNEAMFWMRLQE